MNFNFTDVIREQLGPDASARIANQARPIADYLFNTLLPERGVPSYTVSSANMTVRATMAGLVGMDSPYPPTGLVQSSTFYQEAAKIANHAKLTEQALIRLQELLREMMISGGSNSKEFLAQEALNFLNKVVIQPHFDRAEWMRGQALVNGTISWTFNNLPLSVDYAIPAANKLTKRTSTAAWDSSASAFWADIGLLYAALGYNVRAFIVHPSTLNAIVGNAVNKLEIIQQETFAAGGSSTTVRRLLGDNDRPDQDFRGRVTLVAYGDEGEIIDPSNPGQTLKVPFMTPKKILAVGNGGRQGYVVGQGATADPNLDGALGYTHIGPTVEGGGVTGRWAQLYTPQDEPMQLHGRGASWVMPVIETPELIAIAESEIGGS